MTRRKLNADDPLDRKLLAVLAINEEAYKLFDDICTMLGGPYEYNEGPMSPERLKVFREIHDKPQFRAAHRKMIWETTR